MPFYQKDKKFIHHVHIPKCGGRSISNMLADSGWIKMMAEIPDQLLNSIQTACSNFTNHEHEAIWRCWNIPEGYRFTVVRNPYSRFISKIKMELAEHDSHLVPDGCEFTLSAEVLAGFINAAKKHNGGFADNHFRKQVDFVSSDTTIHFFENGLEQVVCDLRKRNIIDDHLTLTEVGKARFKVTIPWLDEEYTELHDEFVRIYSEDFAAFGYEILSQ